MSAQHRQPHPRLVPVVSAGAVAAAAAGATLAIARDQMRAAFHLSSGLAGGVSDMDDAISAVAVTLLGLCLAWAALVLALTALGAAPGVVGLLMRRAAAAVTPRAARAAIAAVCGLAPAVVAAGSASASALPTVIATAASAPAPAAGSGEVPPSAGTSLPTLDRPGEPAPGASGAGAGRDDAHVVQAGDTLWGLARAWLASQLPSEQSSEQHPVSDAEIAEQWPRWYQANRNVIGDNPNVLVPGETLRPPS